MNLLMLLGVLHGGMPYLRVRILDRSAVLPDFRAEIINQ